MSETPEYYSLMKSIRHHAEHTKAEISLLAERDTLRAQLEVAQEALRAINLVRHEERMGMWNIIAQRGLHEIERIVGDMTNKVGGGAE